MSKQETTIILDADFTEHPKLLALGDKEFRLYVTSIAFCRLHKTSGRISGEDLRQLLDTCHSGKRAIDGLLAARLWHMDGETGYRIHDYRQEDAPASKELAHRILEAWRESTGRRATKNSPADKRRVEMINRALRSYPFEDVMDAVRGWINDPWEDRQRYNDIYHLIGRRSTWQQDLEKFRDLWRNPPRKRDWVADMKAKIGVGA